jgi:hypothetical protein
MAVMLAAALQLIVAADRHFDRVPEVRRLDPLDVQW